MQVLPSREEMLSSIRTLETSHRERVENYLLTHRELVQAYPERLFLATRFFPHVAGVTLNVGVMEMNKEDHLLLPDPSNMRSLDTDPACAPWGSPSGHETCDFFDWRQESGLGGIALFGAIGDRNDRSADAAQIGLEHANRVARHSASLLAPRGKMLLGIELNHVSQRARNRNVREWGKWLDQSQPMHDLFDEIDIFEGRNNIIVVANRSVLGFKQSSKGNADP